MGFETRVTGKWILAGEHAVLRGSPALVFPLYSRYLDFTYMPDPTKKQELTLSCDGEFGAELQMLFWGVIEKSCELKGFKRSDLHGHVKIKSSIPIGAGLGASAALCVAVAKWLISMKWIDESEAYDFSRTLENLFHGESSGVDIAVALSGEGLRFTRHGERRDFNLDWKPNWYLSYSGKRGITVDCVQKVKDLIAANETFGKKIDSDMARAEELAESALQQTSEKGLQQLVDSMNLAKSCFERWGLTEGAPNQHMQMLLEKGALAVKPTGSGGGGYVLSLWQTKPPVELTDKLISCF